MTQVAKVIWAGALFCGMSLTLTYSPASSATKQSSPSGSSSLSITRERCLQAAKYSAALRGVSLLVMVDGKIIFEDYPNGGSSDKASELASGTKSFAGLAALAAKEDGLLSLDEKVSDTITEWRGDPQRSAITIRQLLTLTSGIKSSVGKCPSYADALKAPLSAKPGQVFQYGAESFQIFGELMRRKLKASNENMVDYLKRRVFAPIGLEVGTWRNGADGNPLIPQGAMLTARNWAKLGEFIRQRGSWGGKQIIAAKDVDILFQSTPANPMYGLTWWLNRPIDRRLRNSINVLTMASDLSYGAPGVPNDLVMAAGAGKQRLYVSPSLHLVVVRQASGILQAMINKDKTGFSDDRFLQLLTTGEGAQSAGADTSVGDSVSVSNQGPRSDGGGQRASRKQRLLKLIDSDGDGQISDEERQAFRLKLRQRLGKSPDRS